jgi:hypothetical protein
MNSAKFGLNAICVAVSGDFEFNGLLAMDHSLLLYRSTEFREQRPWSFCFESKLSGQWSRNHHSIFGDLTENKGRTFGSLLASKGEMIHRKLAVRQLKKYSLRNSP